MPVAQPHPTLIIGLGGTGQWVACHVLKELMELYNLEKPEQLDPRVQILAIDTDFKQVARVGVGQRRAGGGVAVSQTELPKTMQVPVGAKVIAYVKNIQAGQYPDIATWFDARWFLEQPENDTLLNLVNGAGQFRPLGRIAVPFNLDLNGGSLRNALSQAITRITQADQNIRSLTVCLTGSLCGGTGAGLAVDVAHLVQSIAAPLTVNVQGYLVLPNAFEGTVPPAPDKGAAIRQRAFAAMRELRRFSREVKFDLGYQMYYAGVANAQDRILRGSVKTALFSMLHYFDGGLIRYGKDKDGREVPLGNAEIKHGMAPLIAEAILLWVDGRTSSELLSHTTNLSATKVSKVATGRLDPKAAVAGGMGVFSLQLPLMHFQEEWACDLGRDVLKKFLGVSAEGAEDATTKTVTKLREDWAGGVSGASGRQAAQSDWTKSTVGGAGLGTLEKDHLKTGAEARQGIEKRGAREKDISTRTCEKWEEILAPVPGVSDKDEELKSVFLSPPEKITEWTTVLGIKRPSKKILAEVPTSDHLSGDARRDERGKPKVGAERIKKDVAQFLDKHVGEQDPSTKARGGSERDPRGEYTEMLRGWGQGHVEHFRTILRAWVAEALNGTFEPARTAGEDAASAVKHRAGKLGYTVALLNELTAMLGEAEKLLLQQETGRLGHVIDKRTAAKSLEAAMERETSKQEAYLKVQQEVLEAERIYVAVRAARWAAGEMHQYARDAQEALEEWKKVLTQTLYAAVWQGQEQVQSSLAEWEKLSAVRQIINLPEMKKGRYRYYAEEQANAVGEILNDLRWGVGVEEVYDAEQAAYRPALRIRLQMQDQDVAAENVAHAYLQRCRAVFAKAWEHETLLGWLTAHYNNDGSAARDVTTLAEDLSKKGRLTLRCEDRAEPYRFVYVRAYWRNSNEEGWLGGLISNLVAAVGDADATHSQTVLSSDPFRLTILTFHELIDVEKLTAYVEGRDGISGSGGYLSLRARSDSTSLSRQVLHVFAAERNATIYEERLGELLPDRIVSLLEDRDRFRLFVQAWAYGQMADGQEVLLNTVRLPDEMDQRGGKWVRRLTTGPFPDDVDPFTGEPLPAQQRWLTEPKDVRPSLVTAAETFLLGGADKWQGQKALAIDIDRVRRQVMERRQHLAQATTRSQNNESLWNLVDGITDRKQSSSREQDMMDYEHYQRLQKKLADEILPEAQVAIQDWTKAQGQNEQQRSDDAGRRAETILDVDLLKVMRFFMADEMAQVRTNLQSYQPTKSKSEPGQPTEPGTASKPDPTYRVGPIY